jgi:hypothetical protein
MNGRRIPDATSGDGLVYEPGDYGRISGIWHAMTPNGLLGNLAGHTVTENADGTITVSPSIESGYTRGGDGGRIDPTLGRYWHGFLEKGVWRQV